MAQVLHGTHLTHFAGYKKLLTSASNTATKAGFILYLLCILTEGSDWVKDAGLSHVGVE